MCVIIKIQIIKAEVKSIMSKKKKNKQKQEDNLKGAFASVMILGFILIISWFSVYALFLSR